MKLKSLLYGAAAVLVGTGASTGAMAADLPVAAEPVEYVRVCDAFGKGFFYIPGTDTCLKVGGRVRVEAYFNDTDDDDDDFYETRARGYINLDARAETDLGLLRTYVDIWLTHGAGGNAITVHDSTYSTGVTLAEAFISLSNDAGQLTVGDTSSFFDFFGGYTYSAPLDQTADATLFAYTFNIGNGVSATLSLEDPYNEGKKFGSFLAPEYYGGQNVPDLIANMRVDQGWGSAQIMGALRDIQPKVAGVAVGAGSEIGWALGLGVEVAIPGVPVEVNFQGGYSEGMTAYVTVPTQLAIDAIYVGGGVTDLTTAWGLIGGVNISMAPNVSLMMDGYYGDIDHFGVTADYDYWAAAATIEWRPVERLSIGADFAYTETNPGAGAFFIAPTDSWQGRIRFQRTF